MIEFIIKAVVFEHALFVYRISAIGLKNIKNTLGFLTILAQHLVKPQVFERFSIMRANSGSQAAREN